MDNKILTETHRIKKIMGILSEDITPIFGDIKKLNSLVRELRGETMITNKTLDIAKYLKTAYEEMKSGQNLSKDLEIYFLSADGKKILADLKTEIEAGQDIGAKMAFGRFEKDLETKLSTASSAANTTKPLANDVVVNINSNNLTHQAEQIIGVDASKEIDNIFAHTSIYSKEVTDVELEHFYTEIKKRIAEAKAKVIEAEPNLANLDVALKQQKYDFNSKNQHYFDMEKLNKIEQLNEDLYQKRQSFLKTQQLTDIQIEKGKADLKLTNSQTDTQLLIQKGERMKLRKNYIKGAVIAAGTLGAIGLAYFFFTDKSTAEKVGEVVGNAAVNTGTGLKSTYQTIKSGATNNSETNSGSQSSSGGSGAIKVGSGN